MATKNTIIKARINDHLKHDVEAILSQLGLTVSDAINVLFNQIKLKKGLPFDVKLPNKTTRKVLDESAKGKNVKRFKTAEELFKDLDI